MLPVNILRTRGYTQSTSQNLKKMRVQKSHNVLNFENVQANIPFVFSGKDMFYNK